jgi:N6-adenosine-specific RNA methylase IME4
MGEANQYDVILADPPWHFKVWNEDSGTKKSAQRHYSIMKVEDICALDIRPLMAENCVLFLWTTWPTIFTYPVKVMKAWGFKYRTEAWTWVKATKDRKGWRYGTGYYTRANTEPCLLAVKGRMPVQDKGVLGLIVEPGREHSRKPDVQYELIERLYPNMRYLELFARQHRAGWDVFGEEVEGSISIGFDQGNLRYIT